VITNAKAKPNESAHPIAVARFIGVKLSQSDAEQPAALGSEAKRNGDGRAQYYFSPSQRVPLRILLFY